MLAVFDTNVLVSALWTPDGKAAALLQRVIAGRIRLCFDHRILQEYREVLLRPKFRFSPEQVNLLLETITDQGLSVVPTPLPELLMADEDDRPFWEVARFCDAPLVTGNLKLYPEDPMVVPLAEFYLRLL